jgi:hypothetical protein
LSHWLCRWLPRSESRPAPRREPRRERGLDVLDFRHDQPDVQGQVHGLGQPIGAEGQLPDVAALHRHRAADAACEALRFDRRRQERRPVIQHVADLLGRLQASLGDVEAMRKDLYKDDYGPAKEG